MANLVVYDDKSKACTIRNEKGSTIHKLEKDDILEIFAFKAGPWDLFVDGRIYFKMKEEKGI